jgi:uncharacterized protein
MRLKFIYKSLILIFLFVNCKEKSIDSPTIPSYIPVNTAQNVVVDLAHLFSASQSDSLASKIIAYEKETTNEVGILTIDSLTTDMDIQRFGTEVANKWGIGKREKNNGLLITISKYNRKISINTGLGTEKTISDYECKVIIDRIMVPRFKAKNYYEGVHKALDSLFILWN